MRKGFSFFKVTAYEYGTVISPLTFQISITEIFCESFPLRVIKKYDKSALMQISQAFGTL